MMATQVYKNLSQPVRVAVVRIYDGLPSGRLCEVIGWSSENDGSPCEAFAVQVEDSSAGSAFVIYGGDWGLRLRPAESTAGWDLNDIDQWGETHLVLADVDDIHIAE